MNLTETANKVNITAQYLGLIRCRKRNAGKELSKKLEKVTGIHRSKWLWPNEFGEPWAQLEKLKKFVEPG